MSAAWTMAWLRPAAGSRASLSGKILRRTADAICFTASPAFALMALVSYLSSGEQDMFCAMPNVSPLAGMTMMYALMGVFHLMPWLTLASAKMTSSRKAAGS